MLARLLGTGLVLSLLWPGAAHVYANETVYGIQLKIAGGARQGGYAESPHDAYISVVRRGEQWLPAGGWAGPNKGIMWGHVESGTITSAAVNMTITLWCPQDPWKTGGRATYNLALNRSGNGSLTGTYTGVYYGTGFVYLYTRKETAEDKFNAGDICPPQGSVTGEIVEMPAPRVAVAPIVPGEHPRILFRKSDLPFLAAKAKTEFGKACLSQMDNVSSSFDEKALVYPPFPVFLQATAFGVRHQLAAYEGNAAKAQEYADKARVSVERIMKDFENGPFKHGRTHWGSRVENVACTYDLCCDAWSPDFRKKVAWYLTKSCKSILDFQADWRDNDQSYDINMWGLSWYAAVGFSGLALMGENNITVPLYRRFGDGKEAPTITPDNTIPDPQGVPVTTLTFDQPNTISLTREPGTSALISLPKYLYATGVHVPDDSLLVPMGNNPRYRPKPGDRLNYGGGSATWAAIPSAAKAEATTQWTPPYEVLDLGVLSNRDNFVTTYLYAVIDNETPRWVEFHHDVYHELYSSPNEFKYYINGVMRYPGDFAYLEKGRYELLVAAPSYYYRPWGLTYVAPRLSEPTEERRTANLRFFNYEKSKMDRYAAATESFCGGQPFFRMLAFRGRSALGEFFRELRESSSPYPGSTAREWVDNMAAKFGVAIENLMNIPMDPQASHVAQTIIAWNNPAQYQYPVLIHHTFALLPDSLKPKLKSVWMSKFSATTENDAQALISADPVYAFTCFPVSGVGAQYTGHGRPESGVFSSKVTLHGQTLILRGAHHRGAMVRDIRGRVVARVTVKSGEASIEMAPFGDGYYVVEFADLSGRYAGRSFTKAGGCLHIQ